jgi:enoyl-CoA hydratase/carnithine racemase
VHGGLIVEHDGPVRRLTLNRPERRNALTPELVEQLLEELEAIDADGDVRAVVVSGAGGAFCAGFDIDRIESPGGDGAGAERDLVDVLCTRLRALRPPAVAKVGGVASGAGCDLAMSCDVRFASEQARLGMPPARLGILYGFGGMARLVSLVGPAAAKELLLSGELVDAGRACAIGLVNRVYPADRLDEEVEAYVAAVVANAPLSVSASKLVVNLIADAIALSPEARAAIDEANARVWRSEDSKEGPQAFRERRTPRFTGS